jgi:hypothetical protein
LALSCVLAGCDSKSDNVCGDIANCSHGGSDDWVNACRSQADDLSDEASRSACAAAYDAYFSCADAHFECDGNKSNFPGCEPDETALDTCLAAGRSNNACGELETKLAACGSSSAQPSDAPASDTALQPCTTGGVCSASCYLDSLANVCAPTPAELSAFADCASHCVP